MAKKEKVYKEVSLGAGDPAYVEEVAEAREDTMFEAEAYSDSRPDPGMETTIMKPVGIGGPVPIVAPKSNTIQLQPIVVPLAVVPYMTTDSGVLRTDGEAQGYTSGSNAYAEAVDFERADEPGGIKKKSGKAKGRIFGLISALLSLLVAAPFVLAYFENIRHAFFGKFTLNYINIIGDVQSWIAKTAAVDFHSILLIIGAITAALVVITALFALISGKYPRIPACVLTALSAAPILIELLYRVIKPIGGVFNPSEYVALITIAAIATLAFVAAVVFAITLSVDKNRKKVPDENPI